jgi:hypothetical protein
MPITVFSPVEGGAYHSPIEVTGLSRTFEGNVSVSLLNADGAVLAERIAAGGSDAFGFFHTYVRFAVDTPTAAVLTVVEMDMAEGTVLSEARRPVVLLPGQRTVDLTYPSAGAAVCGPLLVSGYSSTAEANVVLELLSAEGELLEQVSATGGTLGVYRDFVAPMDYDVLDVPAAALVSVHETDASGRYGHVDQTVLPITIHSAGDPACGAAR